MNVLILAGGFGTRLYPLTYEIPKALVKLNDKHLINHLIEKLNKIPEIENIYILSNNKFFINFLEWKDEFKHLTNKKIKILNNGIDKTIDSKGVLNDFKYVLDIIDNENLLILGSDNLYFLDLNKIIEKAKQKNSSIIALKEIEKEQMKKYGCVLLNENNKVIDFKEKPKNPLSNLASIFCYYLVKKDVNRIKSENNFKSENIIENLYKESDIYGHQFDEPWFDIGCLEELKSAEKYFSE